MLTQQLLTQHAYATSFLRSIRALGTASNLPRVNTVGHIGGPIHGIKGVMEGYALEQEVASASEG